MENSITTTANSGLALCGHSSKMECGFPNKHLSCRQILLRKPAQRQAANRCMLLRQESSVIRAQAHLIAAQNPAHIQSN